MRKFLLSLGLVAAGAGIGGGAIAARGGDEAAWAKLLAGKTAGTPMTCLDTRRYQAQLIAHDDKLAYKVGKGLVFVNQTTGGCDRVSRGDILVTRSTQSRACQGDIATTVDPTSGFTTGSCALGPFTPYRAN